MARSRKHKKARHAVSEPDVPFQAQPEAPFVIDRAEGATLYFKSTQPSNNAGDAPKPFVLDALSDIQPIGTLRGASGGNPYHLIRARPCKDCKQDPSIFIVQPGNPKLARFVEPGKILDNKSRATVMDSRAFYGHCLGSRAGDVYVVFQKEKVDRRKQPQQSVLVVEPQVDTIEGGKSYDHLHETLLERNLPSITRTLHFVKSHVCKELDGRHRVMASRPADLNLKRQKATDNDDDEDSEPPRENQSDRDYDGAAPPATD
ncbi:MAG: hypothetical protein ACJ763_19020 [Bdellovibrionia bacterium]